MDEICALFGEATVWRLFVTFAGVYLLDSSGAMAMADGSFAGSARLSAELTKISLAAWHGHFLVSGGVDG